MEMKFQDTELIAHKNNANSDINSYLILSKNEDVNLSEMEQLIKIIDENGQEVDCTYSKFLEIFDMQGLSGFTL